MSFISYAQNYEDVMLWRALGHVGQGFYIDVGANAPEADSVTKAFYDNGWSGINIEPQAACAAELRAARPRDITLQVAVGAEEGEITLHEPDMRGWATVSPEVAASHDRHGVAMRTTTVPLLRLDTLCEKHAPAEIHFLKIDVEGYEKQVIAGMDFSRFRPWIVVVEAVIPHQSGASQETWEASLLEHRYRQVYFDGLNRFYLAEEHAVLSEAFRAPPNVFDEFTRLETAHARQALAEVRAQLAASQRHLSQTQALLAATREQLAAASQDAARSRELAAQTGAQLQAMYGSHSWRLTRPMRWAGEKAREIRQALRTHGEGRPIAQAVPLADVPALPPAPAYQDMPDPAIQAPAVRRNVVLQAATLYRPLEVPEGLRLPRPFPDDAAGSRAWYRLTGHAEGHYSLAIVNRGILGALATAHPGRVSLQVRDGAATGLSADAPDWLRELANVTVPAGAQAEVCSIVHHYPLIADPLPAGQRLALFFWEETTVSAEIAGQIEDGFDGVLVASRFVKRALRNSGCSLPIAVIPLGVDHMVLPGMDLPALRAPQAGEICRFLHVSSAFPRKGPDLLLKAWLAQFSGDDPAELYVKSFPNPHNRLQSLWAELSQGHRNPPRLVIDEDPLDAAGMAALYRSAHAMILPTRGEGFNLPAAEAMALGVPVLVTGHGGQADFCNLDTAALIPFLFAESGSHLKTGESCWVEPDLPSLGEQLRSLYREILDGSPALQRRVARAGAHVRQAYAWPHGAAAIGQFAGLLRDAGGLPVPQQTGLHVLSPWNTACGIAEYSRNLLTAFDAAIFRIQVDCDTRTAPPDQAEPGYAPSWTLGDSASVARALGQIGRRAQAGDIVLVQHQPSLFRLDADICVQLQALSAQGLVVVLEMHATRPLLDHLRPSVEALVALRAIDRIIVHHVDDMNQLLTLGLDSNLMRMPLGVPDLLPADQAVSRAALGLPEDALVLASFGFLHAHKGVDQLILSLPAIASRTGRKVCLLAVNALPDPARPQLWQRYQELASEQGVADMVFWRTGYQAIGQSLQQLACADFIVFPYAGTQESASGAVTIGLATGKPVLVSNQPIFADLEEITWRMNGSDADAIAEAVSALLADPQSGQALVSRQQEWLKARSWQNVSARLARTLQGCRNDKALSVLLVPAELPPACAARRRQLLVDVSELYHRDARTGIQRVVRNILQGLQQKPFRLDAWDVLPVFGTSGQGFRHTRRFDPADAGLAAVAPENAKVEAEAGDIFLGLDLSAHLFPEAEDWLRDFRRRGVAIHFVVYDIIPLRHPQWTARGMPEAFSCWLRAIARQSDRLLCISATVAADVHDWLIQNAPEQPVPDLAHFPLGADILPPSPATPSTAASPLPDLKGRQVFLSVSTIEPRKGQAQTLAAFEQLWGEGHDLVLIFVGKAGWMMDEFIDRLEHHPERGQRLFWLQGLSDEALEAVYSSATALIAASEAEGFGLPLIEAARHRLPIIARNIPVFREVAGRHAFYFMGSSANSLARAILFWQVLRQARQHPVPEGLNWVNWMQSAEHLQKLLIDPRE